MPNLLHALRVAMLAESLLEGVFIGAFYHHRYIVAAQGGRCLNTLNSSNLKSQDSRGGKPRYL